MPSHRYPSGYPKPVGKEPDQVGKTGVVVEIKPHEQVVVKVDGSRRLTLRNRRFIMELNPRKTRLEDQFAVPERRGTPDDPVTYPGSWRGFTPSPPAQIGVTKDKSMGTEVVVPPTPLSKEVQNGMSNRWS